MKAMRAQHEACMQTRYVSKWFFRTLFGYTTYLCPLLSSALKISEIVKILVKVGTEREPLINGKRLNMKTERLGCTEISIPFYLWVIFRPFLNIQGNRRDNMLLMKSQDSPFAYNNVSSIINLSLSYIHNALATKIWSSSLSYIHTGPQQQKYGLCCV